MVTAVIATRDRPQMVREAIGAALSQDYAGDIEVVVVFDQSTPDLTLARTGPTRSVRVITNTHSAGLAVPATLG